MSGETEQNISGWTVDTLHAHVLGMLSEKDKRDQQRFEAQQASVRDAMMAAERAVQKAEVAAEKRLDSQNEFRGQLSDQAATFMTRAEAIAKLDALSEKIDDLRTSRDTTSGTHKGMADLWAFLVAAIGIAAVVISVVIAVAR